MARCSVVSLMPKSYVITCGGSVRNLLAALLFLVASTACAQWPARPVKLIVPSSAGGGTDFYARLIAQALADALGQQFVVENLPGGSGNMGAAAAARAAPDGYTFLVAADPALTVNQSLFKNLPYDPERDFVPVARGVTVPLVICVQPTLGARRHAAPDRRAPERGDQQGDANDARREARVACLHPAVRHAGRVRRGARPRSSILGGVHPPRRRGSRLTATPSCRTPGRRAGALRTRCPTRRRGPSGSAWSARSPHPLTSPRGLHSHRSLPSSP